MAVPCVVLPKTIAIAAGDKVPGVAMCHELVTVFLLKRSGKETSQIVNIIKMHGQTSPGESLSGSVVHGKSALRFGYMCITYSIRVY